MGRKTQFSNINHNGRKAIEKEPEKNPPKGMLKLWNRVCILPVFIIISDFVLSGHKTVNREIIILLSDLNKVVLCLENITSKNLGQNRDNLKHFLLIDFSCDCEDAIKLIDEAFGANVTESLIFNGKVAYWIVQADFVGYDRVLELETQEIDGNNEHVSTVFLE